MSHKLVPLFKYLGYFISWNFSCYYAPYFLSWRSGSVMAKVNGPHTYWQAFIISPSTALLFFLGLLPSTMEICRGQGQASLNIPGIQHTQKPPPKQDSRESWKILTVRAILRHILQDSSKSPQMDWDSFVHSRHILIISPLHLQFMLLGVTSQTYSLNSSPYLRICFQEPRHIP